MKRLSFLPLALTAGALLLATGCASSFPREHLALTSLLGVALDEPQGGELPVDPFGLSGATYVTDWVEPADMPRLKGRGFFFPGTGAFDAKANWSVQEWVNRENGCVELLFANLDFDLVWVKRQEGVRDGVRETGQRVRRYLTERLGEPAAVRYRDLSGLIGSRPPTGDGEENFLWLNGVQAVRLGLCSLDGGEGRRGSIALEVQRLDALDRGARQNVLTMWGLTEGGAQ